MRVAAMKPFSSNPQSSDNWNIFPTSQFNVIVLPPDDK